MDQTQLPKRNKLRRKGQTLAEFALTLPILLLLTFGIIEFGRLFQAWVTIQNAAREATRYATTGQYDSDRYDINAMLPCYNLNDTPPTDRRGTLYRGVKLTDDSPPVDIFAVSPPTGDNVQLDEESLYAILYDGQDCGAQPEEDENRRKDILRLASIMDVARIGAAGLSLEPNPRDRTRESLEQMILDLWRVPAPRSDQSRYFNVSVCSTRPLLNEKSTRVDSTTSGRFKTIYQDSDIPAAYAGYGFTAPYCMLNEIQPPDAIAQNPNITQNYGLQWLDAGGPGDRVSIFVTFNHPLITPLGLAEYVPMHARRSGVNESFRASRALNAVEGAPPGIGGQDRPATATPSDTPTASDTPTDTPEFTPTPSDTPTPTMGPFDCENLIVSGLSFSRTRVYIQIENRNPQPSTLERVWLTWRTPGEYPGMYLQSQAVNSEVLWFGQRDTAPFDTALLTGNDLTMFNGADRSIPSTIISLWEGVYQNVGNNIASVLTPWDFGGSKFYFLNPSTGTQCERQLELPPAPDDDPDNPDQPDATDTYTPDCASSSLRVEFVGFETFGVIVLQVTNNRFQPAPLIDFNVVWPDPATAFNTNLSGVLTLRKITVGGSDADDFGMPDSEGTLIWRGREDWGDTGSRGDRTPPTTPNEGINFPGITGTWRNNYVFPPRSVTNLFLDFDGTSGRLDNAFGFGPWMLNGTWFNIGCGSTGGTNGSGGSSNDGLIHLADNPIPPPTNTPKPTNTPGPTLTPSATQPSATPSNTWTPGPSKTPTNTPTPTNTQPPQPPTDVPTQDGSGGDNL